jgi:serine/threonine-protein kinase
VLYRLLTGGLPFGSNDSSPQQLARMIAEREPPPPSFVSSDSSMSGELDRIVLKALRRRPEDRHNSAGSMADELRTFLVGSPSALQQ